MKKVLVVDDSALMRSVICDIINSDERFHVEDRAIDGLDALQLLSRKEYDAVVLDVNMPRMNGLELLQALRDKKISARVVMASTDTREGAKTTLDALSLGAIDFVHKPDSHRDCKDGVFNVKLLNILDTVCQSKKPVFEESTYNVEAEKEKAKKLVDIAAKTSKAIKDRQIVCLASSTGGPKALQDVVPFLPANLKAPVVIVQHMPVGFTASLAERLNSISECQVKEAEEGEVLQDGHVYIARGGSHLNVVSNSGQFKIHYSDEPAREGVKPCANYMYESVATGIAERVVCVVLTGMGADGTKGIQHLKTSKKTYVITQNEETCTVYGMPKAAVNAGLSDCQIPLKSVAQEIILNVGVGSVNA
ncbi:MAG: chemotaxis-specific protein-glutamate methyltransferase CheB [Lachnospiraceae bacterium]|nr:chemotaxis-specific protein-glutamate methyltransferase CheB [Lachnospiraceae bacterium]